MRLRFCWACSVLMLATGCEQPSLADRLCGGWAIQTINGRQVPEWARNTVAVVFLNDGTCQRADNVGTFDVLDDSIVRTRIGGREELIAVDVSGDTLTMRTAEGIETVMGRVGSMRLPLVAVDRPQGSMRHVRSGFRPLTDQPRAVAEAKP